VTLLVVTLGIAAGISEVVLRYRFTLEEITAGNPYSPELNQVFYEQKFLALYRDRELDTSSYDPQLGWDYDIQNGRIRPPLTPQRGRREEGPRILVVGDSFAYGNEVGDEENFTFLLNGLIENAEAFTMGVGGYGVDQAAMKFLRYGVAYEPDVVIFAVHPPDVERASLSFFSFAKPFYVLEDGELRIRNVPVPAPEQELERIRSRSPWTSRLEYSIRSRWDGLPRIDRRIRDAFFEKMDALIYRIFLETRDTVRSHGGEMIILEIPSAEVFVQGGSATDYHRHLAGIYERLGVAVVDLLGEWGATDPPAVARDLYINRPDGTYGHLTPEGNRRVAVLLADRLCGSAPGGGLLPGAACARREDDTDTR
jgi:hypothetical protein